MNRFFLAFLWLFVGQFTSAQTVLYRNSGSTLKLGASTPSTAVAKVISQITGIFDGNDYALNVASYRTSDSNGNVIRSLIYNNIDKVYYDAPYITLRIVSNAGYNYTYNLYLRFDITTTSITQCSNEWGDQLIRLSNTQRKIEKLQECNGSLQKQPSSNRYSKNESSSDYYIFVDDATYRERLINGLLILKNSVKQNYRSNSNPLDRLPNGITKKNESVQRSNYVKMTKMSGGTYKVPCTINGLNLNFILDTGASAVSISRSTAQYMLEHGYLTKSDIIGFSNYSTANGSISTGMDIIIRKVKFGNYVINNVKASVVNSNSAPLLLGQSVLSKLGKIQIDYKNSTLTIIPY